MCEQRHSFSTHRRMFLWKYHQSSLSHELQAMDCIVKVVVIDRFSYLMGWRCQATNHHINKWGSGTSYSSFNELTYDGNHESLYHLQTKKSHQASKTKKWGLPLSWRVIGDGNSTLVYNDSKHLASSLTEIDPSHILQWQTSLKKVRKN